MKILLARLLGIAFRGHAQKKIDAGEWNPGVILLIMIILFIVVCLIASAMTS